MEFEYHTTPNLLLRKYTPEVAEYIFTHYNDSELSDFLGLDNTEALTVEKDRFKYGNTMFNKSFEYFHLLNKDSEKVIGWCGYHTWYKLHQRAEIGYMLYSDNYKGKGLMSEALKFSIDYGFNNMNLHRIEAFVGPDNVPSLKLMDKFGFVKEGVLREHYKKNNKMEDSVAFSILKSEYQKH